MTLSLTPIEEFSAVPHKYAAFALDFDACIDDLAREYMRLRTRFALPLTEVPTDGITVLDPAGLMKRVAAASLPRRRKGALHDIARSDFGETLAYLLLEERHGTRFGYQAIAHRESPDLPSRGIDAIGVEAEEGVSGRVKLVLGEVKVSDEKKSPPQVVDKNKDGLRNQHLGHLGELKETARKVFHAAQRATDADTLNLLLFAATCLYEGAHDRLDLIVCSVLVRPRSRYVSTDFGTFRASPTDYAPATIRYFVPCVPGTINDAVDRWIARAAELEATG